MNEQGTTVALVHRVRTFADDVRHAKAGSGVLPSIPAESSSSLANTAASPVQKPTPAVTQTPPLETSHLADEKKPLDIRQETGGNTSQEGTIITDTQRKRWTLGKTLGQSLTTWFDEQKNTIAETADRKNPEPNVPQLNIRTKVLQAAHQKSALAPHDDRHAVVERLRTFARDAERVTGKSYSALHTAAPEKAPPQWSSATPAHALATADTQRVATEAPPAIKQARRTIRPLDTPLQPAKSLEKDVAPMADRGLPEHVFVEREEKPPAHTIKTTPAQYGMTDDVAPLAINTHDGEKEVSATPSRDIAFIPPTFATKETAHFRTYRNDAIHDVEQNKRSIPNIAAAEVSRRTAITPRSAQKAPSTARPFVIAGMVMIVIIAVGGFGFFWYAKQNKQQNTAAVSIPTFIAINAQKSASFSTNRATLLQTLDTAVRATSTGVTQIYPTRAENQTGATSAGAVTTSDFMYVLDPRAPGSFIRNLNEEMMFGAYNGADSFFIFKTKQFDTAFAGMLDWEPYMSADLTPLFGSPVSRTQDLTVRIVDQTRAAHFVDQTLRNVDVRILYDETGKERILYAFLNKNTLVITTSSNALIELIGRLQ